MSTITFVPTQRGGTALIFDGYRYNKVRCNSDKNVTYWRCSKNRNCPGRAVTVDNRVKKTNNKHNHPPEAPLPHHAHHNPFLNMAAAAAAAAAHQHAALRHHQHQQHHLAQHLAAAASTNGAHHQHLPLSLVSPMAAGGAGGAGAAPTSQHHEAAAAAAAAAAMAAAQLAAAQYQQHPSPQHQQQTSQQQLQVAQQIHQQVLAHQHLANLQNHHHHQLLLAAASAAAANQQHQQQSHQQQSQHQHNLLQRLQNQHQQPSAGHGLEMKPFQGGSSGSPGAGDSPPSRNPEAQTPQQSHNQNLDNNLQLSTRHRSALAAPEALATNNGCGQANVQKRDTPSAGSHAGSSRPASRQPLLLPGGQGCCATGGPNSPADVAQPAQSPSPASSSGTTSVLTTTSGSRNPSAADNDLFQATAQHLQQQHQSLLLTPNNQQFAMSNVPLNVGTGSNGGGGANQMPTFNESVQAQIALLSLLGLINPIQ